MQDPIGATEVPLQMLRGRVAGTLGLPSDVLNVVRSPMPMEMFGDVDYSQQKLLPYGTSQLLKELPLAPTSRVGEVAGEIGSIAPMTPAEALKAARLARQTALAGGRVVGGAINEAMVYGRGPLASITPQPMFAVEIGKAPTVFPQENALKLAQQRAALPVEQGGLGLKPNNTAAERAAAQGGKEAIHFSRTGGDFNVLDSGQYAVAPFDAVGTHVGTKEAALDRFRNTSGTIDTPKGSTYPVQILGDRPLMNQNGMPWGEDDLNAFLRKEGGHNWSDVNGGKMTYQQMNAALRKKLFEEQGYTSIPYFNEVEGKGSISYIVPPENLRSRFAAFDPFRRSAAIAAAMGVAAPDLLAQDKNELRKGR